MKQSNQTKKKEEIEYHHRDAMSFYHVGFLCAACAVAALVIGFAAGRDWRRKSNQELESALGTQIEAVVRHAGETARYNATRAYPVWIGFGDGKDTQWYNISQPNWRLERTITAMTKIRSYVGDDPKNATTNSCSVASWNDVVGRVVWAVESGGDHEFCYPQWWLEKGRTNAASKTLFMRPGWQLSGDIQQSGDITITAEGKGAK